MVKTSLHVAFPLLLLVLAIDAAREEDWFFFVAFSTILAFVAWDLLLAIRDRKR